MPICWEALRRHVPAPRRRAWLDWWCARPVLRFQWGRVYVVVFPTHLRAWAFVQRQHLRLRIGTWRTGFLVVDLVWLSKVRPRPSSQTENAEIPGARERVGR